MSALEWISLPSVGRTVACAGSNATAPMSSMRMLALGNQICGCVSRWQKKVVTSLLSGIWNLEDGGSGERMEPLLRNLSFHLDKSFDTLSILQPTQRNSKTEHIENLLIYFRPAISGFSSRNLGLVKQKISWQSSISSLFFAYYSAMLYSKAFTMQYSQNSCSECYLSIKQQEVTSSFSAMKPTEVLCMT